MKKLEFVLDPDKKGDDAVTVSDRKKKKLDILPKILCLLIAIVVWLWMVNLNDTEVTETKILKIEYVGLSGTDDGDVMVYGIDKTEISVTVKGSNRDLKKYADSEYSAVVDVSQLSDDQLESRERITLPVNVIVPKDSSIKVVESQAFSVSMYVDTYLTKNVAFDVVVDKLGKEDSNTYEKLISISDSSDNTISITGPSRLVSLIAQARYTINSDLFVKANGVGVMDYRHFKDDHLPLTFHDEYRSQVNGTEGLITYSTENVAVTVNVIAHKEIGVKINVEDDSLVAGGLTAHANPATVKIAGRPSAVSSINEYLISLSSADVNISYSHALKAPKEWTDDGVWIENAETQIQITFSSDVEGIG
ncbi:MAG: hypothetical protein IJC64_03915 [Clostridia bacterium]|nr:hypothetical protein [Clostridia bacterium]